MTRSARLLPSTAAHPLVVLLAIAALTSACSDSPSATDAGRVDGGRGDAGGGLDGAMDAPIDTGTGDAGDRPDALGLDGPPSDRGDTADGGTDLTELLEAYCAPLSALVCERAAACGCGAILPGGTVDRPACEARLAAECAEAWAPFFANGAHLDADAAAACIDRLEATTPPCGRPSGLVVFAECSPFVIDPAPLGESCATPYCADGNGRCADGTCVPAIAEGSECGDSMFACASGAACLGGSCVALGGEAASCDIELECHTPLGCIDGECRAAGTVGATCDTTDDCAIGLACEDGSCVEVDDEGCGIEIECGRLEVCGGARTCAARLGLGAACSEHRDCEAALHCDDGTRTCVARPGVGDPCAPGPICAPGLGCDGDGGTCRALPGDGEACLFGDMGPTLCSGELACVDGTCGALPVAGESCAADYRCAAGLACDFARDGAVCIVARVEGEACSTDRSCGPGLHCATSGTCEADRAAGEPCSAGNECAGVCGVDASGGFACRDAPDDGDPCLVGDDCPTSLRCAIETTRCIAPICQEL